MILLTLEYANLVTCVVFFYFVHACVRLYLLFVLKEQGSSITRKKARVE